MKLIILLLLCSVIICYCKSIEDYNDRNNAYNEFKYCDKSDRYDDISIEQMLLGDYCVKSYSYGTVDINCDDDVWRSKDGWKTDKRESKSQRPEYHLYSYYGFTYRPKENSWFIKIFQQFKIETKNMIVNNVNEHLAYYNTKATLENEVQLRNSNLKVDLIHHTPHNAHEYAAINYSLLTGPKLFEGNRWTLVDSKYYNRLKLFDQWQVSSNHVHPNKTKWTFHMFYPYNTIKDLPSNYNDWFRDRTFYKNGYKSHRLPHNSTNQFTIEAISIFNVYSSLGTDYIIDKLNNNDISIKTSFNHYLGDLIVGSPFPYHNGYREIKYGFNSECSYNNDHDIPQCTYYK